MKGLSTDLIHGGEGASDSAEPLTTPIYETTTFRFASAAELKAYVEGRSRRYLYSRYANPTVAAVEAKLAGLERAEAALVLASGMAATLTALVTLVEAGDEVVCSSAIYGGTLRLLTGVLAKFKIATRFVTVDELAFPARVLGDQTRVLWLESPINPTLRCVDLRAVAAACRARDVIAIADNTLASPINQRPLDLGIHVVMHSATKYLNGHSDITSGVLAGPTPLIGRMEQTRRLLGTVMDPAAAYALGRGLKTLAVRVERQNATALQVARTLEGHRRVRRVYYPGLSSHPDHETARSQMRGFGGIVTLELEGGAEAACRVYDRLRVFQRAASLGGVESLCSLPVLTSHYGLTEEELARAGVTPGMVRLSVGLEDLTDLIRDLEYALE